MGAEDRTWESAVERPGQRDAAPALPANSNGSRKPSSFQQRRRQDPGVETAVSTAIMRLSGPRGWVGSGRFPVMDWSRAVSRGRQIGSCGLDLAGFALVRLGFWRAGVSSRCDLPFGWVV